MKQLGIFFSIVLLTTSVFSQQYTTRFSNFQADFFVGQNIEHDKKLKDAIDGTTYGVLLSWNTVNTNNSKFNKLFNFPERGYSFIYQNLNSKVLGEVYGAYRHFTYNLTPNKNNNLSLTTGFGVGYANKKYHEVTNPNNHAIGSSFLVTAYLKLQYFKMLRKKNIGINSSFGLLHFSNTAFKNPNLGINTVTFNLGINYKLNPINLKKSHYSLEEIDSKIKFNLILRAGYNESKEIDSGLYPFYTVGFYGAKAINHYSTITVGTELFVSEFLKHYTELESDNNNIVRGGIFVGHELTQNNFSFISQFGFYAYYPKEYESRVFERFGFKYKLGKHLFSEVTLRANLFRAEALEFGIGYTF